MSDDGRISRRFAIQLGLGALFVPGVLQAATAQRRPLLQRAIPSSGEQLPVIGIGTARGYNTLTVENRASLLQILQKFAELGGKMIDTSPEYGGTEAVLGELIATGNLRDALFVADTITSGASRADATRQVTESMRRLRVDRIDLMQLSLSTVTPDTMAMLHELKSAGRVRYVGVVGAGAESYDALEVVMRRERLDFIQVDMSVDDPRASKTILPLAVERGAAVIINHPFGHGRVFKHVLGKAIPAWARDIEARSWAQIFLKYLVAQPGVTVVVPGTERLEFVVDNMGAARGRLPNEALRRKIEATVA